MAFSYIAHSINALQTSQLNDVVDRLHYRQTPWLLTFFAILIGSKQTFGEPLNCMIPSQFPDSWNQFVHFHCLALGTYHTGNGSTLDYLQPKQPLGYYQWVPYVFALQAFCFYVPHLLWLCSLSFFYLDFKTIVDRCVEARNKSSKDRQAVIDDVANSLYDAQKFNSNGYWAARVYLGAKFLNVINLIAQLIGVHFFVSGGRWDWALQILSAALKGEGWESTGLFPRISFCDFDQTTIGNIQRRTVQCVLMINMLNEKAFVVVDLWFFFLLLGSLYNLFYSAYTLWFPGFVKNIKRPIETLEDFKVDVRLLILFVAEHAGKSTSHELAKKLRELFDNEHKQQSSETDPPTLKDSIQLLIGCKDSSLSGHDNQSFA